MSFCTIILFVYSSYFTVLPVYFSVISYFRSYSALSALLSSLNTVCIYYRFLMHFSGKTISVTSCTFHKSRVIFYSHFGCRIATIILHFLRPDSILVGIKCREGRKELASELFLPFLQYRKDVF